MITDKMIELNNVSKKYRDGHVIGDISLSIQKGEVFALCGGNGAGKSTIIQLMTGLIQPTSGTIRIGDTQISEQMDVYKSLFSYMPDAMVFPLVLTGYEILRFFSDLVGAPEKRVEELLKKVGLWEVRNKKVRTYSKGMQQRLSFAQALLPDADVLILDEPTNGLDPYWVKMFKKMILEEKQNGKTILFSSHILPDVEDVADSVAFISEGKLLMAGKTDDIRMMDGVKKRLEDVFFSLVSKG